jgi:thiol-activated cytolysin
MRKTLFSVLTCAFGLLAVSCVGSSEITEQDRDLVDDSEAADQVDEFVLKLGKLDVKDSQAKTEIDCEDVCPNDEQDGEFYCSYTRYTETAQFDEFVTFQPNSATLWPGVVVQGNDAENGLLTPVGVDLAPVTFSVSLENITASPVGEMAEPSLSAFRDARNAILAEGVTGATPAALDFEIVEVSSESQLSVALGASVNWPGGPDIAASFSFDSSSQKTKVLVNFVQAYYTVDVDTPNSPSDFFVPGTTVDDLKPWVEDGNPPLYVQSITYGRRVIFSVQTDRSASEVKAALEASYSAAGVGGGSVNISTEHKQVLAESSIRAFVLGGSGDDATGAISGVDGLIEYIKNGGSYSKDSPGAPIAYKLAYLDNAVTKLAFTTDYAERECVKNVSDVRFDLEGIKHLAGGDGVGGLEIYGQVVVRYPTQGNPVYDCNEGGELAWVWLMQDGQHIPMDEGSTYTPSSPQYVQLDDIPIKADSRICIIADMWEDDGGSGDDDFGIAGLLLEFEDGWTGTQHVITHGTGENSLDVAVKVTIP